MHQHDFAYHEAGHAVFAYFLGIRFSKVTLSDSSEIGGCIHYDSDQPDLEQTGCAECKPRFVREKWAQTSISGPLSERKFSPSSDLETHGEKDFADARRKLAGGSLPSDEEEAYFNWIKTIVQNCLNNPIIGNSIIQVADKLAESKVLSYEGVSNICNCAKDNQNKSFSKKLKTMRTKHNE